MRVVFGKENGRFWKKKAADAGIYKIQNSEFRIQKWILDISF